MGLQPLIAAFFIITSKIVCSELSKPVPPIECDFMNTVNITDGNLLQNGSYEFENVIYNEGMFKEYDYIIDEWERVNVKEHIRGCICAIKSCIRICNDFDDLDHIIVDNDNKTTQKINLKNNTDFHIMIQRPCHVMYGLEDDEEETFILFKASISISSLIH